DPYAMVGANAEAGVVRIYSGATGALLRTLSGTAATSHFGTSAAALGDVNGDRRSDLVVGAPSFSNYGGRVTVPSGATGGVLLTVTGAAGTQDQLGSVVAALGVVNGDGKPDFLAAAPYAAGAAGQGAGIVYAY